MSLISLFVFYFYLKKAFLFHNGTYIMTNRTANLEYFYRTLQPRQKKKNIIGKNHRENTGYETP